MCEKGLKKTHAPQRKEAFSGDAELVTVCMYCDAVRSNRNNWDHTSPEVELKQFALISHGVCPHCYRDAVSLLVREIKVLTA